MTTALALLRRLHQHRAWTNANLLAAASVNSPSFRIQRGGASPCCACSGYNRRNWVSLLSLVVTRPGEVGETQLLQGPFADAMLHLGQVGILRRMAGAPVEPENYILADIQIGTLRTPDENDAHTTGLASKNENL